MRNYGSDIDDDLVKATEVLELALANKSQTKKSRLPLFLHCVGIPSRRDRTPRVPRAVEQGEWDPYLSETESTVKLRRNRLLNRALAPKVPLPFWEKNSHEVIAGREIGEKRQRANLAPLDDSSYMRNHPDNALGPDGFSALQKLQTTKSIRRRDGEAPTREQISTRIHARYSSEQDICYIFHDFVRVD